MEHFLINSSACLLVLWLFYKLALENTSWHGFKRYYLIAVVIVSMAIPFIVVKTFIIPIQALPVTPFNVESSTVIIASTTETEHPFKINWPLILLVIYGLGVVIMLWRFTKNIKSFSIQADDETNTYGKYQLVLRQLITVPHSFLNRIFVYKKDYKAHKIPNAILAHEKAHLDQKHSLDILFIEVILILFWFNPLIYLIKYTIKLNHEFLADSAVINQGFSTIDYQETLLHYTQQSHNATLANTFNFPVIKKRFNIMKTHTSNASFFLRGLALIPVVALVIVSCGKKEKKYEVQEPPQTESIKYELGNVEFTKTPSDLSINSKKIIYAEQGEVITPDIYYKGVEFIVYDNAVRYNDTTIGDIVLKKLYENLTESDKEKVGTFALAVLSKPHDIRIPSASDMEEYHNSKVFRIWIDDEEVPNSKLKDYKISDFKSHSGRMFVTKTGRKTHPQAFNVMFYTHDYFESQNMDKQVKYYGGEKMITYKNLKRVRKNYKDRTKIETKENTQASKDQNTPNGKQATSNYRIITTDDLNKAEDSTSTISYYAQVANEPESEDFITRRLMLMASLKQTKKINYKLNGKPSTVTTIQEYLVNNETADVAFIEGTENTLKFSNSGNSKMSKKALQDVYTTIFKYRPKEKSGTIMVTNLKN